MSDAPGRVALRNELVGEMVTEIVGGLDEAGLTPPEAMTTAEILLWTFMENTMKNAPGAEMQRQAKLLCTRVVMRLTSRIEAWPAKTTERN
jgi:hypothetical protein